MEVGEVEDAEAVELGRQARKRNLDLVQVDPLGLVEAPPEACDPDS
ncbi:MAG: hypothetical protein WD805_00370 [Gaiellaceae bacterium]